MFRALLASLFSLRGLLTLLGLAAIGALIWIGGPYLSIFESRPLADEMSRIVAIAAVLLTAILTVLIRYWLARRANQRMIKSLMDSDSLVATSDDRSQEEIELIRERFENALKVLRETVFTGKRGSGYLFELPWYIIIGPPGAGKTTILKNSGLEFPLADRLGVDPVAGFGGTRNCDWWFTDQAVLIDTAGRYTTQDTNLEVDRAAWRGFLDLLRTYRRRRPINGIMVAISLADLLLQDDGARRRHIDAIRARIQELLKTFGMQIPVYVLITKCDLVAGFTEYFDDLEEEGRSQVWGKTFPAEGAGERLVEVVTREVQELVERLEDGLRPRMHAERNLGRRASIYAFPKEFWGTRNAVGGFVSDVFRASRFEIRPMLRGVYFTSGTQEGTPIDRLIGSLSRSFGLQAGQRTAGHAQGKAFFIRRLLTDVVFAEQGMVGTNSKLERKLAVVHGSGYAAAIAATAAAVMLWYGAVNRSEARIEDTRTALDTAQSRLGTLSRNADFRDLLPVLNATRQVRVATGDGSWLAWMDGLGLSATPALAPLAQSAYDRVLVDRLLPAFANRLMQRTEALLRTGDEAALDQARESFRTYLMLGDPARLDRARITQAARGESSVALALDPMAQTAMNDHLARMIELLPKPVAIDARFAANVRSRLTRRPRADQVYARLLREAQQNPRLRPVDLSSVIGSGQIEFTQQQAPLPAFGEAPALSAEATIPGVFTREGFYDFVLPRLPILVREEQGVDWVLAGTSTDDAGLQQVTRQVIERYVADYIRVWSSAVGMVRVVRFDDLRRGATILQGLAGPQSSLQRLIGTVREHTELPPPGEQATANAAAAAGQAAPAAAGGLAGGLATQAASTAANAAFTAAFGDIAWPGTRVTQAFQPLVALAAGGAGGQPAGMTRVRDLLGGLYAAMSNVATAPEPGQAAFQMVQRRVKDPNNDAFGAMRADAAQRPEPVRAVLNDLAVQSWSVLMRQAHGYVSQVWTREVLPVCQGIIFQRYPLFAAATEDVTLKDFGDFFRPNGVIDDFFQKYLVPLVVDQRNGLGPARIDGVAVPFLPDTLSQFQRARAIRLAFFAGAGSVPAVKFSIRPVFMDPKLLRSTFIMDGKEIVYRHEAPRSFDLEWPTRTEASTVSVTLNPIEGAEERVERSGPWALFRLVDASQMSSRGAADRFTITIGKPATGNVVYELRAASVSNPFSIAVLRSFRCPDAL